MKKYIIFFLLSYLPILVFAQEELQRNSSIQIKAGNLVSIAVGKDSQSSIAIGVVGNPSTTNTSIQMNIGNIFRAAFGEGAQASIQLPQEPKP